jgi:hypothetical protein
MSYQVSRCVVSTYILLPLLVLFHLLAAAHKIHTYSALVQL